MLTNGYYELESIILAINRSIANRFCDEKGCFEDKDNIIERVSELYQAPDALIEQLYDYMETRYDERLTKKYNS